MIGKSPDPVFLTTQAPPANAPDGAATPEKAAKAFESFFVSLLMNELQKSMHLSPKGYMEQTYTAILNQKVSEFIAEKGIGIKDVLMRYLEQGATKVSAAPADKKGK